MPTAKKTNPPRKPKGRAQAEAEANGAGAPSTAPLSARAPAPANPHGLPVVYPEIKVVEYSTAAPAGPLTPADVVKMFRWETEKQWQIRMAREKGGQPAHYLFGDSGPVNDRTGQHQPVHCIDTDKVKVVCWNNANNRPFDSAWCEDLVHTILHGQWAGPLTVPGETVNGETGRISRYGRVLSMQHQGTALVLADEKLQKSRLEAGNAACPKYPFWNGHDHCVIETLVVFGVSEDERILQSIDYVKPRSLADMLYTLSYFRDKTPKERQELTRMLAAAADKLWERADTQGYRTHLEMVEFLKRHKRLLQCVEHMFDNNQQRQISKLKLSAGQCAALLYLMGSSGPKTDGDVYRNESPPSERGLDWSRWERARQFWTRLSGDTSFTPVRHALGRLLDSTPADEVNQGLGGRADEKLAILSAAWEVYRDHPDSAGPPFSMDDLKDGNALSLSYNDRDANGDPLPDGKVTLADIADFEGIDCPQVVRSSRNAGPPVPELSPDEIERAAAAARARRQPSHKAGGR